MPIGFIWQTFLETPLINLMVLFSVISFGSYGLAILLFTVLTRALTFPLTLRTLRSTRALQELSPRVEEIKKKYSDPKRRNEETMKLYRESGVNPLGCLGPQLIQFPIFIALYQVIRITLGNTPEQVLHLSTRLYDVQLLQNAIPLNTHFFFIDLGATGNLFLTVVVFASMWLQQRISAARSAASAGSQQAELNRTMQWMMPLVFGWFSYVVPAGLGLYWAASTIIGIVLQWRYVGPGDFTWGSLIPDPLRDRLGLRLPGAQPIGHPARAAVGAGSTTVDGGSASDNTDDEDTETGDSDADRGGQRKNGRRRRRKGSGATRSESRSGRRRRNSRG